ncbi:uncharacterized protein LOC119612606 [Lucilia sericata]|uniref:uncharacterized protein LOC119612606 n=1 Tax=Lucilia sericata TaxID=13632 RepID=UPI0018A82007|nr:uncharacterized protein LOC119612606 [Lucilia sericata]
MEKVTKNKIITQKGKYYCITSLVNFLHPVVQQKPLQTRLQDLNHDCLREIFSTFRLSSTISLLKSSQQFYDIILYDIWYPYYDDIFDITFCFHNFGEISKCLQLKELTLSSHYLHEPRLLDYILDLPSLQILTLESKDNFYFSSKDHTILYVILKIFSQNPYKAIRGLQLNGMPEKIFYLCPYLQDIKTLNWFVTKIFHRKLDGSVEWKSDVPQVIKSFYDFVVDNGCLENLYVKDNIFHKKRVLKDADFEEKLQELRESKGFQRLNIISSYKQSDVSKIFYDLPEGGVRFFIESR